MLQNTNWRGKKYALDILYVGIHIKNKKDNIRTIPPNLDSIHRNIEKNIKKYHSGLILTGVLIVLTSINLSTPNKLLGQKNKQQKIMTNPPKNTIKSLIV